MDKIRFERQYRTPSSEGYLLFLDEDRVGRLDLHFTSTVVYGTMVLERELQEDDLLDLIEDADDSLVLSADVAREDFIVTVYQGQEIGSYSDEFFEDEEEEEEDEL